MKICTKCREEQSYSEFYKNAHSPDGLHSWCKGCFKSYNEGKYVARDRREVPQTYYIYTATLDGVIVYVGKGQGNRYKHLQSGRSHVYKANESHFLKVEFQVDILEVFNNAEDAKKNEMALIYQLKPSWNEVGVSSGGYKYIGVNFSNKAKVKKWRVRFCYKGKEIRNGYYLTELEAAVAYDKFIIENNIDKPLNFPVGI